MPTVHTSWSCVSRVRWVNFNKQQALRVHLFCASHGARNGDLPQTNDMILAFKTLTVGKLRQLIIMFFFKGYGQWTEGWGSIYLSVWCQGSLRRWGRDGMKHCPNIKERYFHTSSCHRTRVLIILTQTFCGLTCAPKNIFLTPIDSHQGQRKSVVIVSGRSLKVKFPVQSCLAALLKHVAGTCISSSVKWGEQYLSCLMKSKVATSYESSLYTLVYHIRCHDAM